MRNLFLLFFLVIFAWACLPREEPISTNPALKLNFSTDSLKFDTLLSGQVSAAKRLWVYNRHNESVNISQIRLAGGTSSPYKVIINGKEEPAINEELLMAQDSLLIIVEYFAQETDFDQPFEQKDSLIFLTNGNEQEVKLQAFSQDVYVLGKLTLQSDSVFSNNRPYLLTDTLTIDANATVFLREGTQILAQKKSAILVFGGLISTGNVEKPVIIRNEKMNIEAPNQWEGVYLEQPGGEVRFEYTQIKNAHIGLCMQHSNRPLILRNVELINHYSHGLLLNDADVQAENSIIAKVGGPLIGVVMGANIQANHLTLSTAGTGLIRRKPALDLRIEPESEELPVDPNAQRPLEVHIINSIIWGASSQTDEIHIDEQAQTVHLEYNLLRTDQDFGDTNNYNRYTAQELFQDISTDNYKLLEDSPQIDFGIPSNVNKDILDRDRDELPDIGAFEFIPEADLPTE